MPTYNPKDGYSHSRICVGKMHIYSVCEDNTVIKTSCKRFAESRVRPHLKRGQAVVKINGSEYTLKNLVARHFVPGYKPGDYVEVKNGNPFDCRARNLRLYTKSEHGRRTGYRSSSQKIIVKGAEYRSIREAAKALHVSYQTILDYLGGNVKHSVLNGMDIKIVGEAL